MYKKKLITLGIPANIKGFEYLNYAIEIFKPKLPIMYMYKQIADRYQDTPSRVERAMRHAISHINDYSISFTDEKFTVSRVVAYLKILWKENEK